MIDTLTTESTSKKGTRFARKIYPARTLSLGLGFFAVASVLTSMAHGFWLWFLLITYAFAWPHIAYLYATRVSDSFRTGQRQLLFDSVCGGIWVAAMSLNLLPSVLVLTMLNMNNMASGGVRLFGAGLLGQIIGLVGGVLIFGWHPQWESSLSVIIACTPFLAVHPLAVGMMTYGFASRLHEQKHSLKLLSRTDGLTGLYNRRYWQLRAAEEFDRSRRTSRPAVLIMLDIDHFKEFNDRHGHSVGDDVLRSLGHILQTHLRSIDILGRFGGEEFVVVLPDMDFVHARDIAERLRDAVANAQLSRGMDLHCTISLGVAQLDSQMADFNQWFNAADQALYAAKAQGRNCARVYSSTTAGVNVEGSSQQG